MNTNFKLFSFILATVILMACVNQTYSVNEQLLNPVLTIEEIVNSQWKFFNSDGYLGDIKFEKDGRVTLYDNFNEKFWKFERAVFHFYNGNRALTSRQHHHFRDYFGKWHLQGSTSHLIIQC